MDAIRIIRDGGRKSDHLICNSLGGRKNVIHGLLLWPDQHEAHRIAARKRRKIKDLKS